MKALSVSLLLLLSAAVSAQSVFINEIHYDNASTDVGEAIEVAGPAGTDLSAFSLVLYNGNGGAAYNTTALSGSIPDLDNGFGVVTFNYPTNGIQNGSPDGVALIENGGVVQFLSYEGTFAAVDGPAVGLTSVDIGVAEASSTPAGFSLQLTGSGSAATDFTWAPAQAATFDAVNAGQSFGGGGGGPPTGPSVVINEIHADPASGDPGDANGDGIRDFSSDEFIELVNIGSSDLDVSGWTLADGVGVRHEFPPGSIVQSGCAVVVFGGNTPVGSFGGALVQIASSGALSLNNGGDTIVLTDPATGTVSAAYGGEGGADQSLTRDPDVTGMTFVQHTSAIGAGGALYSPGTRIDGSQFAGCDLLPQGPFEIYELQGDGDRSPFNGVLVTTNDNVVTALAPDGFFIQTPASRSDGNIDTSDGIFVFTDTAPTVAVGDQVDVTGQVQEFFDFTEITGDPVVTVDASGLLLPSPVVFDANTPSPDPAAPSCAIEFECYEGMLVQIENGSVGGGNQRFNPDPVAEVFITAGTRAFREPGVEFPGLGVPTIATWDGNPEVFELDPDKLGLPNRFIAGGSTFDAIGVIGFEFGGYELWPIELNVRDAELPSGVRARGRAEITVGSLNMFRLFDDVDDPADTNSQGELRDDFVVSTDEYATRRSKFVDYIVNQMDAPDVLAVQEVESLSVLETVASDIAAAYPGIDYQAFLEEGNDVGTIDVGFLVREYVAVESISQLGKDEILDFDGSLLNDRPPLLLEGRVLDDRGDYALSVMVLHNRSLGGIDSSSRGERVRAKRLAQAQSVATQVQALQSANPDVRLVVIGDLNAFEFSDGYVDVVGQIAGSFDPSANLVSGPDLVEPDLVTQTLSVSESERYSFIFRGNAQALDHALTSSALDLSVRGLEYARGNADAGVDLVSDASTPVRASDHDGLVLYLTKDQDDDGVNDDADFCPATAIPEAAPTRRLGFLRYALTDGDFEFDTRTFRGRRPWFRFTTENTAGCSCEQIADALHLGASQTRYGCSVPVMLFWSAIVEWRRYIDANGG